MTRPTVCSFHIASGSEAEQRLAAALAELRGRFGDRVEYTDRDLTGNPDGQDFADECEAGVVGLAIYDPATGSAWRFHTSAWGIGKAAERLTELLGE